MQIRYDSVSRGHYQARVDPIGLVRLGRPLSHFAYCKSAARAAHFAVERIQSVTPTDHPLRCRHFDLDVHVQDARSFVMRSPRIEVELEFNKTTAAWVRIVCSVCHAGKRNGCEGGGLRMTSPLPIPVS